MKEGLSDMEKREIEGKTQELLKRISYQNGDVDVISIAHSLGFVVGNASLDDDDDGFVIVNKDRFKLLDIQTDRLIGVNSSRELEFKRFVIAHEIGHYILHYDSEKNTNDMYAHRDHKKPKDQNENDADYFAANLLMPTEVFKREYNGFKAKRLKSNEIIILLASYFKVPNESVARRVNEIGLT